MLDDVAVVDVGLRSAHAGWEVESRPDGREVTGVGLDGVLVAALGRVGRLHRPGRERARVDSAGNAVGAFVGLLVCLDVKGRTADHLEGDQVHVHRMRVCGQVDVHPVLDCTHLGRLGHWPLVEVDAVQIQEPGRLVDVDLVQGDVARPYRVGQLGPAPRQARRDRTWAGLAN